MKNNYDHNREVTEFLKLAKKQDPDKYQKTMEKYPVINRRKFIQIQKFERSFSNIGGEGVEDE